MSAGADAPAAVPAVEARGLGRRFGSAEAVCGLDLRVEAGTFFGFLGPNGAGKTTTIRMLTGLLPPTTGEAFIGGEPVGPERTAFKRLIGVVPEGLALFDRLSLAENMILAGRLQGLAPEAAAQRAADLLRLLDLDESAEVHAVDGSHGMRKKAALGMALIHAPRVLFLDEPFAGLDPLAARTVRRLLERLAARGVTVFMTSHVLEVVEKLCERIAIIAEGRVVLDGWREELARDCTLEERFASVVGEAAEEPELPWLA